MATSTTGVHYLIVAERRATEKVSDARKRRIKRVQEAQREAQLDISSYTKEMDDKFNEYQAQYLKSSEGIAAKINAETDQFVNNMLRDAEKYTSGVIHQLLNLVFEVKPELHRNYLFVNKNWPKTE